MGYEDRVEIDVLVGEVLTHVDECGDEILLTTASGKKIKIFHAQDCCESCSIVDTEGNWHDLIGKVIVEAEHDAIPQGDPPPEFPDSWTRTNLKFRVDDATVISRWIGESNGYYSEGVDIEMIANGFQESVVPETHAKFTWTPVEFGDCGLLCRFYDRVGDDPTYGVLVGWDDEAPLCETIPGDPPERFFNAEKQTLI